jgi:alpha-beta hydrolase superfamily lysophospholipase
MTRYERLDGDIPALMAHPDWAGGGAVGAVRPRATLIWLHGRTVTKELDTGRYLRLLRAEPEPMAVVAIDLPGHGERLDPEFHTPTRTLDLIEMGVRDVDRVVAALGDARFGGAFDADRLALGGMSAGGMITLRRLCDPHTFKCAHVESTSGHLARLYGLDPAFSGDGRTWPVRHDPARVAMLDPMAHTSGWRDIPLLAMHSRADALVPVECIEGFIEVLRARARERGLAEDLVSLRTWERTGAPQEHSGFGQVAAEARAEFVAFLGRRLA